MIDLINTIQNKECILGMSDIPDNSIDLIFSDLPFGTTKNKWDSIIPFHQLWKQYERIIKDNGAILLFSQSPFDKVLACSNLEMFRYEWIWEKTSATGHLNANKMPLKAHENILVFYKKLPKYNPIKTKGARKVSKKESQEKCIMSSNYGKNFKRTTYDSDERFPRSVLKFKSDKQQLRLHPTQKPVALAEYLIKTYTDKNDVVLDNCIGSGTTAVACANTKRNFIGFDNGICERTNRPFADIANDRVNSIHGNFFEEVE